MLYLHRFKVANNSVCLECGVADDSPDHNLTVCDAFLSIRRDFNIHTEDDLELNDLFKIDKMLKYFEAIMKSKKSF